MKCPKSQPGHSRVFAVQIHVEQLHHVLMPALAQQRHFPHNWCRDAIDPHLAVIRHLLNGHDLLGSQVLGLCNVAADAVADDLQHQVVTKQAEASSPAQFAEAQVSGNDLFGVQGLGFRV